MSRPIVPTLLLVMMLAAIAPPARADYAQTVIDSGAFAYWRLSDAGVSAADSAPIAPDLVGAYSGSFTQQVPGLIDDDDTAARFNSASSIITIPDDGSLNSAGPYPHRSVDLWFNADGVSDRQILWEEGGDGAGLNIYLFDGRIYFGVWFSDWGSTFISAPVQAQTTYHAAVVFDQSTSSLIGYLDGSPVANGTTGGSLPTHAGGDVSIGAMVQKTLFHDITPGSNSVNFGLIGTIDEVAVYNHSLEPARVLDHYRVGSGEIVPEPAAASMIALLAGIMATRRRRR